MYKRQPFLYYLINIGAIIYDHGQPNAPSVVSLPSIFYPTIEDDLTDDAPGFDKSEVTIARDRREIETLAALTLSTQGSAARTPVSYTHLDVYKRQGCL